MEEHDQQLLNLQLSYLYNNVPVNLPKIKQVSAPIIPSSVPTIKDEKIEAAESIFLNEIKVGDESSSVAYPENSELSPSSLKCRFCFKTKSSKRDLILHERIHTGVKEFKCKHCAREFTWKQPWIKHEGSCRSGLITSRGRPALRHRTNSSQSFSLIKQENPGSDSKDVSTTRTPPAPAPVPVPAVGAGVAKDHRLVLTENMNQVLNINIGRYKCNCCPRRFASMSTAQNHQNVHKLGPEFEEKNPYEDQDFHENQNVKAKSNKAKGKAKASRSPSKVRLRPKKIKRNIASKKKKTRSAASTIIGHRRIRQKEQRQKKIAANSKLTTGSGSVSVSKNVNGSSQYRRNRNIRSRHLQMQMQTKPKPTLNSFVPVRGGRVKRITYTCSYCPRGFTQRCNFLNHERQHTGEEPFSCERCGSKFKAASGLSYHLIKSRSSPCSTRYIGIDGKTSKSGSEK